ncbi:MAG: sporulation protein YqfD, partial [Clostridia bacterium]|nr:sporulation protein YqfD [Clostridia bacterium]
MAKLKKGLLRISYEVSGKNIKYLPEYLHIKKVCVYKFCLKTENTCFITIDFADNDKFFAICKNMCYNKKVTGYKGILSPLAKVVCSIGLSLGILLFSLSSYLLGGVLLGVKVEGSAKCFANETIATVKSLGVEKYDLFSSINYDEIEREVLKSNQKISFVSVYKRGNFLIVSAELSSGVTEPLSKSDGDLVSTCNGVIEELSVLRGTALVNVGDTVKVGD